MGAIGPAIGLALRQRPRGWSPAALFAGGVGGGCYDPADFGAMAQNADGSIAAAVEAPVGLLRDKSGRGNHLAQAASASRPVLRRDSGGRCYLELDGVDDFLSVASADFDFTASFTVGIALRFTGGAAFNAVAGKYALNAGWDIGLQAGIPRAAVRGSSTIDTGITGYASIAGVNVVLLTEATATSITRSVNRVRVATGGTWTPAIASTPFALGQRGADATSRLSGRVYGLVVVGRALSTSERALIEEWLSAKCGVPLQP